MIFVWWNSLGVVNIKDLSERKKVGETKYGVEWHGYGQDQINPRFGTAENSRSLKLTRERR
ncbi:1181_t:CDS:2 [Funneliformis caledonium]|uniref:1181_t:CDS:1 n=1 Tax=Funneliformis caledonium TaxID=1117310 RepID=A0A9N9GLD9_9GLOM|nr:1181_t:CDS:2 [Funneliformis caledonium]